MTECMSCGGFVTDNYARVFGDNDDNVFDCRNCRTDRRLSGSDECDDGDDGKVLLRSIRGEDEAYSTGRGNATTGTAAPDDGRASTETSETGEPTPTVADGGVATPDVAHGPTVDDGGTDQRADETADDPEPGDPEGESGRFGIRRFLSSLRS